MIRSETGQHRIKTEIKTGPGQIAQMEQQRIKAEPRRDKSVTLMLRRSGNNTTPAFKNATSDDDPPQGTPKRDF